ncbi:MAG: glutamine--tRNA ligase/YqeY domain fusion protein [Planctomycetes bacterium]|nr:glutamine--tRNA ligase/YqeY domain fusion protein [Planctomycetota bacterium]MCB9905306.1 glutamine--tRNA ligase/YqeY domain fusion protein [Planctomycetota bacterium]
MTPEAAPKKDFIRSRIASDVEAGKNGGKLHTRFPPEPNGYLHIGHAQAIWLNFSVAEEFGGKCNLRFDDTNPGKEDVEYVDAIRDDIRWLGYDWDDREFYASDYFRTFYDFAVKLVRKGKAYVDSLPAEEISAYREAQKDSPYRERSVEENLDLLERMRKGEFDEGTHILRAKIDMRSPNLNLRDPAIYRIRKIHHDRTGDEWCIYPMYDFAHGFSDSIEGITHSLCTLEFENHRPLYDWFIEQLEVFHPQQIEFARLNVSFLITSKRKLLRLVQEGHVSGWDDPRMPTIRGLRRRGYTPASIRDFCSNAGITKVNGVTQLVVLENAVRKDLNATAPRMMAVLEPLKLVITNYPEGEGELLDAVNNPEDPSMGSRKLPFSRELYIERDDFREDPPKGFFRLSPGTEVRLRYAYYVKCEEVVKDANGEVVEVRCTYDPATKSGQEGAPLRKVKGTLHWVSAPHAVEAEVRLYDNLFRVPAPEVGVEDFLENLNPDSLRVLTGCKLEPELGAAEVGQNVQFERLGYFCVDQDSQDGALVFNRTVSLRDSWAKVEKAAENRG